MSELAAPLQLQSAPIRRLRAILVRLANRFGGARRPIFRSFWRFENVQEAHYLRGLRHSSERESHGEQHPRGR